MFFFERTKRKIETFLFQDAEQFGLIYSSIDGQTHQLIFRIIHPNNNSSTNTTKSTFTDSMSSLSSISTLSSSCTRTGNTKTDVLYHLAKAISDDRCLLDTVNLIDNSIFIYCSEFV